MSGPSKGNIIIAGLNGQIRHLNNVIEKMKQEQAQGEFIEALQCAAITGLCSQPFVLEPDGVEKVIKISNDITNGVIHQIMSAVRESQREEASNAEAQAAVDSGEAQPGAIEHPDSLPEADRIHPKPELIL